LVRRSVVGDILMVAEIGINHNGEVDKAKKLIDRARTVGFDFVKFQKRTVEDVYTPDELAQYRESPWGYSNREQKEGLEFSTYEYNQIDEHCKRVGIKWFASPWDRKSVDFLARYEPPFIKVASPMVTNTSLLDKIASTGVPVILSTGMSTQEEVREALHILGESCKYILACTSTYPTFDDEMNLNFISTLQREFPQYQIGFSNHSPGIFYSAVSAVMGAKMIEIHITLDRAMYGSDQAASVELPGMTHLLKWVRCLPRAMGTGEWIVTEGEKKIREKLRK
jgi:N-acetylneuraminate synthase